MGTSQRTCRLSKGQLHQTFTEKELEPFLATLPPTNIKVPLKLDPFMKTLLEKKGNNKVVTLDEELVACINDCIR